jgi:hypothetical protein
MSIIWLKSNIYLDSKLLGKKFLGGLRPALSLSNGSAVDGHF